MAVFEHASWICGSLHSEDGCPVFRKGFSVLKPLSKAFLSMSALGVYLPTLNGGQVGDQVMAPGWTSYDHRIQYQTYEVTDLIGRDNTLSVIVAKGWYASPMPGWVDTPDKKRRASRHTGLIAELEILYADGTEETLVSDASWLVAGSPLRFAEIYDGEVYDASFESEDWRPALVFDGPTRLLVPQEGEDICETERVAAKEIIHTPAGERVVDFGQEVTGYVEFSLVGRKGETVTLQCGEVLDREGNFYHGNYRSAKAELVYVCKDGPQTFHPILTFYGFRYVKLSGFPDGCVPSQFTAIVVCSLLRQTGRLSSGIPELNQLFSNVFWGQKGNFLDVPTDCPQRDERLGWTGDAQVFCKTATYNFDTERFFKKWLKDLALDQRPNGAVGQVIPDYLPDGEPSAAWGDAATVCPWQVYQSYGCVDVLKDQFESMRSWVDFITHTTTRKNLWTGGTHFGDWLGLDAPEGSYKGSSRDDFIASAYYAHSTELVVKAGHVLGKDVSSYEKLLLDVVRTFRETYPTYLTETEHVLALQFGLTEHPKETADALAGMIQKDGEAMRTGFVGTGYLLHVLGTYGHGDLAYTLLLRKEYPSWLYPIGKGATTIWEHWDGIKSDGSFWSDKMNSFNHYAYGSVLDWVYEYAAGIGHEENAPAFSSAVIEPHPDKRLQWLDVELQTRNGVIHSAWRCQGDNVRYTITVDMPARIIIKGKTINVRKGTYTFWS